jgi:NAD(P)H-hydrate epimerase
MVVTPHPGELRRLLPEAESLSRADTARGFAARFPSTLLFKGARTIVTAPGHPLHYNSTGTPGMATGGQGDVLTGLVAALLAGGLDAIVAARAAAWLSGRAAELALGAGGESVQSLLAGDTARMLGAAFLELQGAR